MTEPSLPDKVVALHQTLDAAKIPHALGGAIALAYYAEPRATVDVDINIFLPPTEFERTRAALAPLGVAGDVRIADVTAAVVERDGQCRLVWGRTPVDLFFAYDDVHAAMRAAVRKLPFGDTTLPILAPEHLVVCKAVFNRPKDWLDIEQVFVAEEHLDLEEIRRWVAHVIGERDDRYVHLDALAREVFGALS